MTTPDLDRLAREATDAFYSHDPMLDTEEDRWLAVARWTRDEIDIVIPHQVSIAMNRKLMDTLRLPIEKSHVLVEHLGNTASTTVPVTLAHAAQSGRLRPGMKVLLVGVGSGVSVGLATLVW